MAPRSSRQGMAASVAALGVLLVAATTLFAATGWRSAAAAPQLRATAEGSMALTDSRGEGAIFDIDNIAPGSSGAGEVTITNSGTAPGALSLASTGLSDDPGRYGGLLSQRLVLRVAEITSGPPKVVFSGGIAAMPELQLGTLATGQSRTYRFTVTMLDGGAPSTPFVEDNTYQEASTGIAYLWTLTEVEGGDPGPQPEPEPDPEPPASPSPPAPPGAAQPPAPAAPPTGTQRADLLVGSSANDAIFGRGGNDRLFGKGGNDRLYGGPGRDRISGGAGRDVIVGGPGADLIDCGPGRDLARVDSRDRVEHCERVQGLT
jgi:Ca2+-binding RTX toxin-like protein